MGINAENVIFAEKVPKRLLPEGNTTALTSTREKVVHLKKTNVNTSEHENVRQVLSQFVARDDVFRGISSIHVMNDAYTTV